MIVRTSAEVDVHHSVLRDEIRDPLHFAQEENFVGLAARFDEREILVTEHQQLLVRDRDERVDVLGELRETDVRTTRALTTFEEERLRDDADCERALLHARFAR